MIDLDHFCYTTKPHAPDADIDYTLRGVETGPIERQYPIKVSL